MGGPFFTQPVEKVVAAKIMQSVFLICLAIGEMVNYSKITTVKYYHNCLTSQAKPAKRHGLKGILKLIPCHAGDGQDKDLIGP